MDLHERVAGLSPEKRALLLERLRDASAAEPSVPSIRRRDGDASSYPLSFAQERLWFLEQLEPGTAAYNMPAAVRLSGRLDVGALRWSLEQIQDWQEPLRTRFATVEGEPVQVIAEAPLSTLEEVDLGHLPEAAREAESARWVDEAARRPFDLTAGPLLRTSLLKLDEAEHVLLVVMHHVISDAWSVGLFFRELARLYEGHVAGAAPTLPELPIQYVDYVHWQRERLQGGLLAEQLDYWKRQLDGAPDALELPTDRPRPPVQTFEGATQARMLSRELSASLRELSEREGVTLFMTLLAAFQTLLMRYSGQEDVVVGSPIAGRTRPELEELIGFFVNTLVFRTDLAGDPGFRALLRRVRATCLEAYGHQEVPFERLVAELQPERVRSRPPLCQVLLVLQNVPMPDVELPGLTMSPFPVASGTSKFDLTLFAVEIGDRLALSLEHNTHLFDESTARRLLGHYERLLEGLVSDPGAGVRSLPLLTEPERARVVEEWSGHRTPYPRESTIQEQFEREVARAPGAEAVVCGRVRWSYGELNERANRLAHRLKELGVGAESRVGLCVARSPELVVGLLGILKAGGAYVPLDPEYPAERLAYMATDAGLEVLLTTEGERDRLPALAGVRVVSLDGEWESIAESGSGENPACETGPESLAYVMYTSGSTGKPKGTLVEQRGVVRLVKGTDYVELGPEETLLQFSTISFDASTFEIWGALLNGGRLVVYPDRRPTLEGLAEVIQGEGVTTLWLTAGLFHEMVERHLEGLRGVRQLLAGGDVLSVEHVKRAVAELDGCRVINGYGPTENTTFTCCHAVTDAVGLEGSVPIGRPIANTEVYLLDRRLEPVPVGVPGRLYTGGDGLARAYLNDAELTAARFVAHPFRAGERLYDTGDRARWRPDGTIEFLGRDDQQVKIRGYRVEPGEVETAVAEHPRVRQVVVAARGEGAGEKRLVAYVVPSAGDPLTIGELREQVRGKLPDYMIPQALVCLEALPLTANGKVDRAALPEPEAGRGALGTEYAAPRTELERTIAEIWQEVLEIERVGLHDNFFDLGGNSLRVMQVYSGMRARSHDLSIVDLFTHPTVGRLARHLSGETSGGDRVGATQERAARRKRALHARQQLARQAAEGQPE